eukprot:SAG11_NODE_144_length_14830_cov_17.955943_7_plen_55_part_00
MTHLDTSNANKNKHMRHSYLYMSNPKPAPYHLVAPSLTKVVVCYEPREDNNLPK